MEERSLELRGIGKSFPGVRALDDINFKAEGGKVLALLGENGAGKSTLLKIINGDLHQDEGTVLVDGKEVNFTTPQDAINAGISIIYQERQLLPFMSVMENLFVGDLPKNKFGIIDKAKLRSETQRVIDDFGLPISPDDMVGRLNVAHQQMIEIMKAYRRDSPIIAYDEPTAPLTDTEIEILFKIIRKQKEEGKVILYVSHRLNEIFEICDDIVILKDGKYVKTLHTADTNENELITAMVGRDIGDTYANLDRNTEFGDVVLELKDLKTPYIRDINITGRRGEIIGLAGLVGAGRTEIARAIFGVDPITGGQLLIDGKEVHFKSPHDAINAGIALCPEDRKYEGLILFRSIKDNISMPVLDKLTFSRFFVNFKAEKELAEEAVKKFDIKTPSIDKVLMELSGGNQQKVILGRWTSSKLSTKILILDEPTKGIDVGTKAEIYQNICNLAKDGLCVVLISSELPEVINIADTIYAIHNGHITGKINREDATEENVLTMAMLD
ncbi:MAG: sugar ABC transporter ATP-binding protein [Lachnospiraceae bacterium]|jgi:ABC-type sugar transport system ATPase subunit|nr:sugar ABC transporter ATP-binding protein [Lachnospiraceae bacterium]MBQ1400625.1 sugar ABC transporter ATP-binding protein [Lachnospiraceae bacterium]MBQ1515520.1 sugar ABC transporter ATP-binding protein [Lachnospiraceae bacterium]MBQ4308738.1 sugar ABC transporter ATP-binding protein [Lachnospiraceae bacterium]